MPTPTIAAAWKEDTAATTTVVSNTFNASIGDLVLVFAVGDDNGSGSAEQPFDNTLTDSGTPDLTWTMEVDSAATGSTYMKVWSAIAASAYTGITVTATRQTTLAGAVKALIVVTVPTGTFNPLDPIGATWNTSNTSTTNNWTPNTYTSTVDGSRGIALAGDWSASGAPTSTDTESSGHNASSISYTLVYKASDTTSSGTVVAFNFDAGGAGAADWRAVALEIKPVVGGGSNTTITPTAGSATLTGIAPVVTQQLNRTPSVGALALTGIAPLVIISGLVQPGAGSLALTGSAPVVTQQITITPNAGSLTLTGIAPTVSAGGNVSITPSTGSLTLTGGTVEQTLTVPPPTAAALVFTGVAPVVTQGTVRVPTVGALALTGIAPVVTQQIYRIPGTGALVLTGAAPAINGQVIITPNTGALSITASIPVVTATQNVVITPGTGTLTFTGYNSTGGSDSGTTTMHQPAGAGGMMTF